jgi:glycosyltransferase involved in cell wall biosynthesis
MRILHLITTLDVGGAEMHLLAQVRGQRERGHEVRVLYLKGQGTLAPDFRTSGAEVVPIAGPLGFLARGIRAHLAWCDVFHSHLLKADMLAAVGAALHGARRKLVSSKHNDEQILKHPLVSRIHGVLGNFPARTIVLSDHVGRFVERYGRLEPESWVRIYYGLDPAPFEAAARMSAAERAAVRAGLGLRAGEIAFTCVARFAPQKAHDVLIRAFARTRAAGLASRLVLVGDDPFGDGKKKAEALAHELGPDIEAAVVFTGIRRDVPQILAASEVFVMSSLWEGLGLVFLEAMATGLPVLSTRVSAIPEVVVEGTTGLLVPPSDERALAEGMLALASDAALRSRLGAAGRERVRARFGLARMIDETIGVYRSIQPPA